MGRRSVGTRGRNNLGYISYAVARGGVGPEGFREVGHFISPRGNNFWGRFPLRKAFGQKKAKGPTRC